MGPLHTPKDLARIWNEFLEAEMPSGILHQQMSKEFVKATRDMLVEKVGSVTVSEKEQKRVTDLIVKLQHENKVLRNQVKGITERYESLKAEFEKANPTKPIWWHWLMDQCRNEKCSFYGSNVSQGPVHDDLGEDINLFTKVDEYNRAQREKDTDYRCEGCGSQLKMMHRHASADWNCIVDDHDDPIRKEPLVKGQEFGSYITEEKYQELVKQANTVETK